MNENNVLFNEMTLSYTRKQDKREPSYKESNLSHSDYYFTYFTTELHVIKSDGIL